MSVKKRGKQFSTAKIAFYGAVVIALIIIVYFTFNPRSQNDKASAQPENSALTKTTVTENSPGNATGEPVKDSSDSSKIVSNAQKPETESKQKLEDSKPSASSTPTPQPKVSDAAQTTQSNTVNNNQTKPVATEQPKVSSLVKEDEIAIKIAKNEVTSTAKFYPYKLDNTYMEVIAVKATDGSIRTALNTCQVCYDSGKGYYVQVGDYLVCQNCRNKFHIDQVEKVKGGCNPVPILEEDKKDTGDFITISKEFMDKQKEYFSKWKKQ